jgi:opacity protein-like surface antigen
MMRSLVRLAATLLVACGVASAWADEPAAGIDLASFGEVTGDVPASLDAVPLEEVSRRFERASRRIYLSGMIGPSFANVSSPADASLASSDTLFNAGGALGIAFERPRGLLRLEVEGMGRSTYDAPFVNPPLPDTSTKLTNNWSVMQNVWRDLMLTDRFGVYGGGGIGAGGYILGQPLGGVPAYAPPAGNFAWQFGGGLLWEVTDRLTFDVGYRYFQIDTIHQAGVQPSLFEASELMFSLRLYEPFRNWRR